MKLNVRYLFLFLLMSVGAVISAQTDSSNIFKSLSVADSVTGAKVKVYQEKRIEDALADRKSGHVVHVGTGAGYRIQVFSSNVQRTAKSQAFEIEKELKEFFPTTGVYVSYTSPFWKVRVGDFKTLSDAQVFMEELTKAFPKYKNETYTVKDKVNY